MPLLLLTRDTSRSRSHCYDFRRDRDLLLSIAFYEERGEVKVSKAQMGASMHRVIHKTLTRDRDRRAFCYKERRGPNPCPLAHFFTLRVKDFVHVKSC